MQRPWLQMSRRSYEQYCPLAQSLDIVGERWTLLIIRELQLGPRRFSDLERGLPGLSPNLLSDRLGSLERRGLITRQPLPPPARAWAYALTANGQALNTALIPLAQWGAQFLQTPIPEDEFLGPIPAMVALRFMHQPQLPEGESLAAEVHLGPDSFRIQLAATDLQVEQGFLPGAPLVLHTEPKPLLGLAAGALPVSAATEGKLLEIERGTIAAAETLFAQFRPIG
jgi:DNA-binding HxlR family transcriptional regulator